MSELQDKLLTKRADIQARFDKLEAQRKQLSEQRANLDRNIAVTVEEQVRIQGEFRLIEDLSNDKEKPTEPKLEIPKESKKKK